MKILAPIALTKPSPGHLRIAWNDGSTDEFAVRDLRIACPCAACVNEWTGERMLDPAKIAPDVLPQKLTSVGRYAMAIHWSDGHRTGIYSYEYLKKLAISLSPEKQPKTD